MELHDDMGHVECCGPFEDTAGVDESLVHGLRQTYRRLRNHFGGTRWYF
jgi:hypothetical protein